VPRDFLLEVLADGTKFVVIQRWLKREGDVVVEGEPVIEVEGDKTTFEISAPVSGTLLELVVTEGDEVRVGALLGIIEERS
jgi:pyruvate/2-oxoglutarate dehydrogenase complex dihydrolipoamide acyltransferase (E2) component